MSNDDRQKPANSANSYIFAGVGAVLGGVVGAGAAGAAAAVAGVVLGGLLGYNFLKKI
jgi:osmotically inducible lipoprotein OsmB